MIYVLFLVVTENIYESDRCSRTCVIRTPVTWILYHMNNIIPITVLYLNIPSVYMFASIGFLLIIGLITNHDIIKIHKKLSLQDRGNTVGQCVVEHEKRNIERK